MICFARTGTSVVQYREERGVVESSGKDEWLHPTSGKLIKGIMSSPT